MVVVLETVLPEHVATLLYIWKQGNLQAHSFIPTAYWEAMQPFVAKALPLARIFVEQNSLGEFLGFIGIADGAIAGLFVAEAYQKQGIGTALLEYAQQEYARLSLAVYRQNVPALMFYLAHGFCIVEETLDHATGEMEYHMQWEQPDAERGLLH